MLASSSILRMTFSSWPKKVKVYFYFFLFFVKFNFMKTFLPPESYNFFSFCFNKHIFNKNDTTNVVGKWVVYNFINYRNKRKTINLQTSGALNFIASPLCLANKHKTNCNKPYFFGTGIPEWILTAVKILILKNWKITVLQSSYTLALSKKINNGFYILPWLVFF